MSTQSRFKTEWQERHNFSRQLRDIRLNVACHLLDSEVKQAERLSDLVYLMVSKL